MHANFVLLLPGRIGIAYAGGRMLRGGKVGNKIR